MKFYDGNKQGTVINKQTGETYFRQNDERELI